jgi:hypothetical protein
MYTSCYKAVVFALATGCLFGQTNANKGAIAGVVVDAAKTPIAGVSVTAESSVGGMSRVTITNQAGAYRLVAVDPGTYNLSFDSDVFSMKVNRVEVTVGANVNVDVTGGVSAAGEHVETQPSSVEVTNAASTDVFHYEVIRDLPIDGRRFQDFASLAPGVQANEATHNQLSFLGQTGVYANVMVDGGDYNEPFLGGIRGGDRAAYAFTIPQSAIQEFQIVTNGYSPEYGRSTSGILNAITRAGSNALHGETFYQLRHRQLGLSNPFGQSPLESQHQFGGAAGGPIVKNRLFFFGAAEGQFASFPRTVRFAALDSVANSLTPDILPAYQYFRSLEGPYSQTNNAFAALGRLDYQFSNASRLTGRFSASQNNAANAVASGASWIPQTSDALSNNGTENDFVKSAAVQWTSLLLRRLVNDLRVTYSAENRASKANSLTPTVEAGVIGNFGAAPGLPANTNDYRVQTADSLTIQRGLHSFAFGADYSLLHVDRHAGADQFGAFVISGSDVRSLLSILSASGNGANRFDSPDVVYRRQVGDSTVDTRAHQIAFFGQDEWRPMSALTLTYGLRWEGQLNPQPRTSNDFLLTNVQNFSFPLGRVDPAHIRSQWAQWAPRAAVAWNPGEAGKTVMRASAGMFYGQTPLAFYANALNNFGAAGGDLSLQIAPSGGLTVYQQFAKAGIDLNRTPLNQLPLLSVVDVWMRIAGEPNQFAQANVFTTSAQNFRNPRSLQFAGGIEHRLARNLLLSYQLNHLNTVHLPRVVDVNVPQPFISPGDLSLRPTFGLLTGTPRPNPNLGSVYVLDSSARSTYTGNTVRALYQMKRVDFMAHFTLSYAKSDGEMQWPFTGTTYLNPFNLNQEWGWSSLDARYQSAGYVTVRGPKGFDFSALFRAQSGLPVNALTGSDLSGLLDQGAGDRPYLGPGVPLPHNAFRNLGFRTIDARVLKAVSLGDIFKLQLSAEMFNLFNFNNAIFIPAPDYPNNPAYIYGAGVLPSGQTVPANPGFLKQRTAQGGLNPATMVQQGPPLQAQLGMRLLF